MDHFASLKTTLARLEPAKLAALGAVGVVVLALIGWVAYHNAEPMALLYAGLDPAEAGRIGQRLDELKVTYEPAGDGGTIRVPASQVARVRMELAASGLPHQAGAGYELLDNQSPMNMTSFMQKVQRLRALEGELGRTILTLDGIRSARVHIVLPERDSFSHDTPKPTASVAVVMQGPARMSPRQAAAIRLLVAGAVPALHQEDVSVIDPMGIVLAADGDDAMAAGRLDEMKTEREQGLQRATMQLLEPLVGQGHVRAVVSVDIDGTREVSHDEKFDPLSQVERSRQTQTDQDTSDDTKPTQPVSVAQNLPNAAPPAAGTPGKSSTSTTHNGQTVNYELNSTRSDTVREPGGLKRLTVAVVVDGTTDDKGAFHPRPKEELDRIAELVRSAVGFDAKRGDIVTVDTMHFIPPPPSADMAELPANASSMPWLPAAGGVGLALGIAILMLRKRKRAALAAQREEALALMQVPVAALGLDSQPENALPPPDPETLAQQAVINALHEVVDRRPDEALAVIRAWIAEGTAA